MEAGRVSRGMGWVVGGGRPTGLAEAAGCRHIERGVGTQAGDQLRWAVGGWPMGSAEAGQQEST